MSENIKSSPTLSNYLERVHAAGVVDVRVALSGCSVVLTLRNLQREVSDFGPVELVDAMAEVLLQRWVRESGAVIEAASEADAEVLRGYQHAAKNDHPLVTYGREWRSAWARAAITVRKPEQPEHPGFVYGGLPCLACGSTTWLKTIPGRCARCGREWAAPTAQEQPESLARRFHEIYERLAPSFGYETREASAVPWAEVPEQNRKLMVAVCREVLGATVTVRKPEPEQPAPSEPGLAKAAAK